MNTNSNTKDIILATVKVLLILLIIRYPFAEVSKERLLASEINSIKNEQTALQVDNVMLQDSIRAINIRLTKKEFEKNRLEMMYVLKTQSNSELLKH